MSTSPIPAPPLPVGWTAWIDEPHMTAGMGGKCRPFCRGRSSLGGGPWFPRTSKAPSNGTAWAVYSPPNQLPSLDSEGWFLAHKYIVEDRLYVPSFAHHCGTLREDFVQQLHAKLQNFFWDARQFRR